MMYGYSAFKQHGPLPTPEEKLKAIGSELTIRLANGESHKYILLATFDCGETCFAWSMDYKKFKVVILRSRNPIKPPNYFAPPHR